MQQAGLALVALAACVALCPSDAILPIASSCCTEVSQRISRRLLQRVNVCRIQRADGDCDLAAVMPFSFFLYDFLLPRSHGPQCSRAAAPRRSFSGSALRECAVPESGDWRPTPNPLSCSRG
ncbi:C-C motif chemokine 28 isoform X3 [Phyllostomus hastatus]|uniref:C-C motif chemokine 28 isoform X3 n=1 Tax=Phyllostomus hastatus TaxID=9423 RepID=UPI001E6802D8|nr:C-C motif chemokine 28 isoform X3 [Phyllostomus hastatus]